MSLISLDQFQSPSGLDSFNVLLAYKDIDGDLGYTQEDTSPPYHFGGNFYNNLVIEYLEKIDGVYQPVAKPFTDDTIRFGYRIPLLTPQGRQKSVEGTIQVGLVLDPFPIFSPDAKFRATLSDRALHRSEPAESDPITR